jgi:hypothetical protein
MDRANSGKKEDMSHERLLSMYRQHGFIVQGIDDECQGIDAECQLLLESQLLPPVYHLYFNAWPRDV